MTNLEVISGLLNETHRLKDVAHIMALDFEDGRLAALFAVITSTLELGARATPKRVGIVLERLGVVFTEEEMLVLRGGDNA